MTVATHTNRLGLIAPAGSDTFDATDYAATFNILDALPGLKIVPSYSGGGGLTTLSWGTAQHGSTVLQADNGALWYWNDPSGSGTWKRLNSVGLLKKTVQNADVSSAATSGDGILVVESGNLTIPGGRYIQLNATLGLENSSGNQGMAVVQLHDNGSLLKEFVFKVGVHTNTYGNSQSFDWYVTASNNSTHNYGVYARAVAGSTSIGAGGTTTARTSVLNVIEV